MLIESNVGFNDKVCELFNRVVMEVLLLNVYGEYKRKRENHVKDQPVQSERT